MSQPAVCFAGTHDPGFTRNLLVAEGLRQHGYALAYAVEPSWGSTAERVAAARRGLANPSLAWRLARAYARVRARMQQCPPDAPLYVGYPGQLDTVALRMLAPSRKIVLDAFVSIDETLADRGLAEAGSAARRIARILDRLAFRLADLVVVDTAAHRRRFTQHYGLDARRAVVVPVGAMDPGPTAFATEARASSPPGNGANHLQAERVALEARAGGPLRVLYFGGFIPLHGVPVILEAARLIPPDAGIEIHLVGDGQEADRTAAGLGEMSLPHVRLKRGWMPEWQLVAEHIATADVCLGVFAAAPKTMDIVPAKIHLALACGRAVVTADTPAIREEVLTRSAEGPALLTCPPGDPRALADALLRLRDDAELRAALGRSARSLYERYFRPERIVEPLIPALQELAT